jgi:Secretion system C-terminal sorting domain
MKKYIVFLIALIITSAAEAQPDSYEHRWRHRNHKCPDEKVQRLDSVYGYVRDAQSGIDLLEKGMVYEYQGGRDYSHEVVKFNLPERTFINRQLYTYSKEGFKQSYLYQEWAGNSWEDIMLTKYFQNDIGKLGHELFARPDTSGQWLNYQQHFYEYDQDDRIALYRRQMARADGSWYDFSENIWTFNDDDQLLLRIEKRIPEDNIIWTETFNYGDGIKPVERIRQTMRYNPALGYNTLTNDTRNLYQYDQFNDPSVVEYYRWKNNEWVYEGKDIFFYSFIPGRKVTICHNGHTISIAPQALPAHLAHGDKIGCCADDERPGNCPECRDQKKNSSVIVFPNPATTYFEVRLRPDHQFSVATLISGVGRIITSKSVENLENISFNIANLKSGNYLLKLSGQGCEDEVVVIMK